MSTFLKTFFIFIILFSLPASTFALEISFDAQGNQFTLGEEFIITIQVDAQGQYINAIEGSINFPTDLVDIKEIRDGNSSLNFWVERPNVYKSGTIKFAGITPGGFSGSGNSLFSVVLGAIGIGNGAIYSTDIRSFLNDGVATKVQVKNKSLPIIISKTALNSVNTNVVLQDTELPESFTPIITNELDLFDGKYFIVFVTQDKASGIDSYKIKEGEFGFFREAISPHLLTNQNLDRKIYVKAVDKAGNERVEVIPAQNASTPYRNYITFAILLVVAGVILSKKVWLKYTR
jgi:hypothetical protein